MEVRIPCPIQPAEGELSSDADCGELRRDRLTDGGHSRTIRSRSNREVGQEVEGKTILEKKIVIQPDPANKRLGVYEYVVVCEPAGQKTTGCEHPSAGSTRETPEERGAGPDSASGYALIPQYLTAGKIRPAGQSGLSDVAIRQAALFQIALVILLGPIKLRRGRDLRHDRPAETGPTAPSSPSRRAPPLPARACDRRSPSDTASPNPAPGG